MLMAFRDEKYLHWIRRKPSVVTDKVKGQFDSWDMDKGEGRNDPHHLFNAGKPGKTNDYLAVPLTRALHTEIHFIGHETFEEKYNVNLLEEAFNLLCEYVEIKK